MTNFEEYQAETEKLEKRGIILAKELQEQLIALGVFPHLSRYFLEDILPKNQMTYNILKFHNKRMLN